MAADDANLDAVIPQIVGAGTMNKGKAEGARCVHGGGRPAQFTRGWFVEPTLFADIDNRMAIARSVRTGTYNVNTFLLARAGPFGGTKSSGIGHELGPEGLRGYLESKTICFAPGSDPA